MKSICSKATLGLIFSVSILSSAFAGPSKVIYGADNRYDADDYPDAKFRELSKSVAGQVRSSNLVSLGNVYGFYGATLQDSMGVCNEERFAQQKTLPRCSGFLVAKDILVTAGHCVTSINDCSNYNWVFDFKKGTNSIKKENVYRCKEVIGRKQTLGLFATKDYAIIRLDRAVKDRTPLELKMSGNPKKNNEVVVIGHPSGLPLKIADGAKIRKKRINFFYTNLDTYGGNSGSPVFDQESGQVLGILIQGANDYVRRGYCNISNRIDNNQNNEKVFKIKKAKELKDLL